MASTTLLVGILADLLTAAFAIYVALRVHEAVRRDIPVRRSLVFWYGMAGFLLLDGGYAFLVLSSNIPLPVPLLVLLTRRLLFLVGTAALVLFLLELAGHRRAIPYMVAYYAAVITFVEAQTLYQNPIAHEELVWSIQFAYERETPLVLNFLVGLSIFLPLMLAAGIALARYPDQHTTGQRFRLVMLTAGVISFCVGIVIGFWDNEWYWYGLFENRLAFSIAAGMLFALRPFWLARRRWGLRFITRPEQWPR